MKDQYFSAPAEGGHFHMKNVTIKIVKRAQWYSQDKIKITFPDGKSITTSLGFLEMMIPVITQIIEDRKKEISK